MTPKDAVGHYETARPPLNACPGAAIAQSWSGAKGPDVLSSAEIVARSVRKRRRLGARGGADVRTIVQGDGWRAMDIVCFADSTDRSFEERHEYVSIAVVLAGAFSYRSAAGTGHLATGSILLGGAETCFSCGHEHGAGDRCIAFQFSPQRYEEILFSVAGKRIVLTFPRVSVPANRDSTILFADAEALAAGRCIDDCETLAQRVVSFVAAALDNKRHESAPSLAQAQIMSAIARAIEEDVSADHSLKNLAALADMSPFHFLRCFKRVIGMTPHAFVRVTRLREAARLLRDPKLSIATIAFEVGFQDLSVFNDAFRQVFGTTPRAMRASMKVRATE